MRGSLNIGRGKESLLAAAHALPPVGIGAVKHLDLIALVETKLTGLLCGVTLFSLRLMPTHLRLEGIEGGNHLARRTTSLRLLQHLLRLSLLHHLLLWRHATAHGLTHTTHLLRRHSSHRLTTHRALLLWRWPSSFRRWSGVSTRAANWARHGQEDVLGAASWPSLMDDCINTYTHLTEDDLWYVMSSLRELNLTTQRKYFPASSRSTLKCWMFSPVRASTLRR